LAVNTRRKKLIKKFVMMKNKSEAKIPAAVLIPFFRQQTIFA
jgi:hypothetical protein